MYCPGPMRTRSVPQITFLNVEKLSRIGFIRVFFSCTRFEEKFMFYLSKTPIKFGSNSLFNTNIDNGLWDMTTVTMQFRIPEL